MLFDALLVDTLLEDLAALDEVKAAPAAPRVKGQAARQALPANLPRVERHHVRISANVTDDFGERDRSSARC